MFGCARVLQNQMTEQKTAAPCKTDLRTERAKEKSRLLPNVESSELVRLYFPTSSAIVVQNLCRVVQRGGEDRDLLPGPFQIVLVDGLTHARNHHCGVASVLARSVNDVTEPWTVGQSVWNQQGAFRLAQGLIEPRNA